MLNSTCFCSNQASTMSEASFAAIEALIDNDQGHNENLVDENLRLRQLLAEFGRLSQPLPPTPNRNPPAPLTDSQLHTQLHTARRNQELLRNELAQLRAAESVRAVEDEHSEVAALRSSLSILSLELAEVKARNLESEAQKKDTAFRSKPDESRRALARMQSEPGRRAPSELPGPAGGGRRSSGGGSFTPLPELTVRRKSSLGRPPATSVQENKLVQADKPAVGLGLGVAPSSIPRPRLGRAVSLGGPVPLGVNFKDTWEEDEKAARLKAAKAAIITTRIASRGPVAGPVVDSMLDLFEPERRRIPSISIPPGEEPESCNSSPPLAPLRALGRNASFSVFCEMPDPQSRRGSAAAAEALGRPSSLLPTSLGEQSRGLSRTASTSSQASDTQPTVILTMASSPGEAELRRELAALREQLAESEEGRIASERCLASLKLYVNSSPQFSPSDTTLPPLPVSLPGSPSPNTRARWGMPRLPQALRRDSSTSHLPPLDPNLTTFDSRRASATSASSTGTLIEHEKPLPPPVSASAPTFGGFSFSALVNRSGGAPVDADTSPTMKRDGSGDSSKISSPRFGGTGFASAGPSPNSGAESGSEFGDSGTSAGSMTSASSVASDSSSSRSNSPERKGRRREEVAIWEDVALDSINPGPNMGFVKQAEMAQKMASRTGYV